MRLVSLRSHFLPQLLVLAVALCAAGGSAFAQTTLTQAMGGTSSVQTKNVYLTSGGTVSSILVFTEGVVNQDFQLSSSTCAVNQSYSQGKVCQVSYTFAPQYAGLRRGGIAIKDSNGNPLGEAYISGVGTGPQAAFYPLAPQNFTNSPPPMVVTGAPADTNFAIDGAENVYVTQPPGVIDPSTGFPQGGFVYKDIPNCCGYSQVTLASNVNAFGSVVVDGIGNIFFVTTYPNTIAKLTPNNTGAVLSTAAGPIGSDPLSQLAVDANGALYVFDNSNTNFNIAKFTPNGTGGFTQTWVSPNPSQSGNSGINTGCSDIQVDAAGNVWVAAGQGVLYEWVYDPSNGTYTNVQVGDNVNLSNIQDTQSNQIGYNSIALEASGNIWDIANDAVMKLIPTGGGNYTPIQPYFDGEGDNLAGYDVIREGPQGDIFIGAETYSSGAPAGMNIYKLSAGSPISQNFGSLPSGGGPTSTQNFEFTNIGNATLTARAPGLSNFTSDFPSEAVNWDPSATEEVYVELPSITECTSSFSVPVANSCNLSFAFSPASSDSGTVTDNFLFYDNSGNSSEGIQELALSGTAVHPLPTITNISPSSGTYEGGTTFVITGTALGDVSSITFNNCSGTYNASYTINSTTQITAVSEFGCPGGIANITVTNPAGSATAQWTYNQEASASRSTLTIAASSIAQNGTTTLRATAKDSNGNPLVNDLIAFTFSNSAVASAPSATTNSSGVATATVIGLYPGSTVITAYDGATTFTQTVPLSVTDASQTVGSSLTGQKVVVTFTTAGTLGSTLALTQGASNTDFTYDSSTCTTGTAYAVDATCTVTYSFNPTAPGLRLGAIVMETSAGSVLGTAYLSGIGDGPQAELTPGLATTVASGMNGTTDVATDGLGNLYYVSSNASKVAKISGGNTTVLAYAQADGLVIDGAGNLFYSSGESVYELVSASGSPKTVATFTSPAYPSGGMAFDGFGNLYVALSTAGVAKIAPGTFAVTTIAGPSGTSFSAVAVDASGDLFLTDNAARTIYEMPAGSTSATIIASGLLGVSGLAVDAAGNVYTGTEISLLRLAAGGFAPTTIYNGLTEGLSIDRNGTIWAAQYTSILELNRTAGATLSFSSNLGVETQQSMTLENDGNTTLSVSGMAVSSPFAVDNSSSCNSSISLTTASPICSLTIDFTPTTIGNVTGTATFTDNSVNNSAATQTAPLSGTGFGAQTITFPQPTTPVLPNATATLTASANSGLAVTYAISSGPATLSGSTVTYTGTGTVVITASQPGNASYTAATPVSVTVVVGGLSEPVGSPTPTQSATITITTAGKLQSINALTKGAANKDYQYVSGSTASNACTIGTTYAANATCTVTYSFNPTLPGQRLGAISLTSSSGAVMGTQFLSGTGIGPQAIFPGSTAISTLVSGLNGPESVVVDGSGDVFYTGDNSGAINEIVAVNGVVTSSSQIVTIAGSLAGPEYLAIDGAGNLFVTENFNNEGGDEENPGTVTELIAVNGQVSSSSPVKIVCVGLNDPQGVAVDASGDVFVSDYENNELKEVVATNGSLPANSSGTVIYSINGEGLAVDASGDVFVAAPNFGTVVELVAVNGLVNTSSTIHYFAAASREPYDVRLDAAGDLFVADPGSMAPSTLGQGASVSEIVAVNGAVTSTSTVLTLNTPFQARGLAIDGEGHVYVADTNNNEIRELDMTTAPTLAFGSAPVASVSTAQTTTLENVGDSALTFSTLAPSSDNFVVDATSTTCSAASPLAASGICTIGADFTPAKSGALTSTINITDNSDDVSGSEQQVPLTGTGTTGTSTQTITFPQPTTPVANGSAPVTLTATASSNLAITYSVISGPATVSGSILTYTGPGTVVVEAAQYGNATYAAAAAVQRTITVVDVVSYTAPTTPVNTTSATQTATVNFTVAGTLGAIDVSTQGAADLDFKQVTGGTCAIGTAYSVGQTCTINCSFTPMAPGGRSGAVVLEDGSGKVLGTSYLSGVGTGPQGLFTAGVLADVAAGLGTARGVSVDAVGNLYVVEQGNGNVDKFASGTGVETILTAAGNSPAATAVDGAGNVYFGSTAPGAIYELVGGTGTPVEIASGWTPDDVLVVDGAGNLYSPDGSTGAIHEIAAGTHQTTLALASGTISRIIGMTVDGNGNLFAADFNNNVMYEIAAGSGTATKLFSANGLSNPHGLAIDAAGDLYVTNYTGGNVQKYTKVSASYVDSSLPTGGNGTRGITIDSNGNLVMLTDSTIYRDTRTTTSLSFGSQGLGIQSASNATGFENDGNAALTISALNVSGTSFAQASATPACSTTVALGAAGTCNVSATFTPQSAGPLTGDFNFSDNTLNVTGSLQQVTLTGTGTAVAPVVSVASTSVNYGASPTLLTAIVTYSGVQPTGAVTIHVDSGVDAMASCTAGSGSETCSTSYATSGLTVGSHTITAAIAADSNYNTASNTGTLTVNDTLASFTVTGIPALVSPGASYTATVTAIGASGATFTAYNGAVTLSSTDGLAIFTPPTYTYQPADNGAHSFTVSFGTHGTQTVTATAGPATGSETGIVVADLVWMVNANGGLSEFTESGSTLLSDIGNTSTDSALSGVAIDSSGGVWSVTPGSNTLNYVSQSGTGAASYTGGGLNAPTSVAVDGNGQIWVTNGNGTLSVFTNTGIALSPSTGYLSGSYSSPGGVAIDASGNVWVSNAGNNSVTEVLGAATPAAPLATEVINQTTGKRP